MNTKITLAALALGVCLASVPAFAQTSGCVSGAPLSPGGIGAAADAFGGPGTGYIGPVCPSAKGTLYNYVAPQAYGQAPANAQLAPLSPGGIGAAADAFGGPGTGYIGPRQ